MAETGLHTGMEIEEELIQLLLDIRTVLDCHHSGSIDPYPGSEDLAAFLAARVPLQVPQEECGSEGQTTEAPKPREERHKSDPEALEEIGAEVGRCQGCTLAGQRKGVTPGRGGSARIRLMIIGHWLSVDEDSATESGERVFGYQEDLMLERMLAAIHLPLEEVFVTNIIKCTVGPGIQPQAEHIEACASYLQRQIRAVSPQLICTMGMVATRTLLKRSQPLSRLRGQFYLYQALDGTKIPLIPTFHPGYLLQNPEMKKATWTDLQTLEARLQEKS